MMEWLSQDIDRGQTVLIIGALLVTAALIWIGRRRLIVAAPCAFIFLLLAAIAIPSFLPARNVAYRNACINNLHGMMKAKAEWAEAEHKLPTDIPTLDDLCGTSKYLRHKPVCPNGGLYTIGPVNEKPTCGLASKGHKLE